MVDTYANSDGAFHKKGKRIGNVFGVSASCAIDDSSRVELEIMRYQFGGKSHQLLQSDGRLPGVGNNTIVFYKMADQIDCIKVSYNIKF
jgi:hypothetical protein